MSTKVATLLNSARISMEALDEARSKIDTDLSSIRPREVSDAIEAMDEALRSLMRAVEELSGERP